MCICTYRTHHGAQVLHTSTATAAELGVEAILDPTELAARAADPFYKLEAHAPQQARRDRMGWLAGRMTSRRAGRPAAGRWADSPAGRQTADIQADRRRAGQQASKPASQQASK